MYIETRKTWIKAIHECIMEKWNPVCMGCYDDPFGGMDCALCNLANECDECPLNMSGNKCTGEDSSFTVCEEASGCTRCSEVHGEDYCAGECPSDIYMTEAEAMLEALVMLLPPEERKRYEP